MISSSTAPLKVDCSAKNQDERHADLQHKVENQNSFEGPLKGKSTLRENRDMSEGLQNSRSQKLGALVSMADQ